MEFEGPGDRALEGLREIRLPEAVSYAPQTIGWWVVFALVGLAVLYVAFRLWRRWKENAYRRAALERLETIERQRSLGALPDLIKRTALDAWPREVVAELSGGPWLAFLDRSYGGDGFSRGPGRALPAIAYGDTELAPSEVASLLELTRTWIRQHRA